MSTWATSDPRCCVACGRWGVKAFRPAGDGRDGWVCSNDRACQQRSRGPSGIPSGPKPQAAELRIRAQVTIAASGCWEWQGARDQSGYGRVGVGSRSDGSRRTAKAHRVSYETFIGPIPDGLVIDHLCRNPSCVNPMHLEPVTTRVNTVVRGQGPIAVASRQTTCINGHEYTVDTTWTSPTTGKRSCRACRRTGARTPRGPSKPRGQKAD